MQREVVVLVEVHGPDQPAVIRRGRRHWEQWLSPDMIAEIGSAPLALYEAEQIERVWSFKRRVDCVNMTEAICPQNTISST